MRAGFSLVEVIISVIIIAGLMVAVLNTVGATAVTRTLDADRAKGQALAYDLLDEVLQADYEDAVAGIGSFGVGADEAGADRSLFDDVDDYDGWESTPPMQKDGSAIDGFDGWTRRVDVVWCEPSAPDTSSNSDTRLKRITVTVTVGDRVIATVTALRGAARDELGS